MLVVELLELLVPGSNSCLKISLIPRHPEASCFEVIYNFMRKRGFSERAMKEISVCIRKSSTQVCQGKWLVICDWCRRRNISPVKAPV